MNWDKEIEQLEEYYSNTEIPTSPIRLDEGSVANNPKKLFHTHLPIVKANNGNIRYKQYLNRLQKVRKVINQHS